MSNVVISIDRLSKRYQLGHRTHRRYETLRDVLINTLTNRARQAAARLSGKAKAVDTESKELWALRDVSLDIERGEAVGIIGRNGAGKSTLLKILSRITEPTSGIATIRGRVGSLLEVGTGFHLELTGRENIYLNGAVLGMKRAEIDRKFDEIIDFAEVERFIDTAVKHYSTGMYLRLAFAVAAHLETDILLVDEVLAVGDASFQEKCIGKMNQVAKNGRTVFFVSHNLGSIRRLCTRAIALKSGLVYQDGDPSLVIDSYLQSISTQHDGLTTLIPPEADRSGTGTVIFTEVTAGTPVENGYAPLRTGSPARLALCYKTTVPSYQIRDMAVAIHLRDMHGMPVTTLGNNYTGDRLADLAAEGTIYCDIDRVPLMPGNYLLDLQLRVNQISTDKVFQSCTITVLEGDFFHTHSLPPRSLATTLIPHTIHANGLCRAVSASLTSTESICPAS
jgi:lipopolysaccharide transport system ATP-binding protein